MNNNARIKPAFNVLEAPYIKVDATVIIPGATNGKSNIPEVMRRYDYVVAPSAKKIATYIVNQIFGSKLVTQTEGLQIGWLMPTLKSALELSVYQIESFIWIHKYNNKIYLECLKRTDIFDLVQKYDDVVSGRIVQEIDGKTDFDYLLERRFEIKDGKTYLFFRAFEKSKKGSNDPVEIDIGVFNKRTGSDYLKSYVLPYEAIINIDIGQDFFADSRKLLTKEMDIINTMFEEIDKTKTRIVSSQHFQSGDIVTQWKPGSTSYDVRTLTVGQLQDYFTLLPGDKDHSFFEFLQGDVRIEKYEQAFKFCDYQVIQMSGLSTASFGYEKDAYMNVANVDLSKNASDMTVEAIKTQIEPQINRLIQNIVIAQTSIGITENVLPATLAWDYGINEKFDDMKKLQVMGKIQSVASIPYSYKAKIIMPILKKLIDTELLDDSMTVENLVELYQKETEEIDVKFGEV